MTSPAAIIVRTAPIGSTTPDSAPYRNAFHVPTPSDFNGREIIAPSGKFWIAIPRESTTAPVRAICVLPAAQPA